MYGAFRFRQRSGSGPCGRRRCARALRRQSKREDYLQRGPPARHRASPALAPGVPLHEGWGRGWCRLRVTVSLLSHPAVPDSRRFQRSDFAHSYAGALRARTPGIMAAGSDLFGVQHSRSMAFVCIEQRERLVPPSVARAGAGEPHGGSVAQPSAYPTRQILCLRSASHPGPHFGFWPDSHHFSLASPTPIRLSSSATMSLSSIAP